MKIRQKRGIERLEKGGREDEAWKKSERKHEENVQRRNKKAVSSNK